MAKVAEAADDAVDAGTPPAEAIAKAARDHGLPVSHVPVVVRAFNTGRAVRQLSETDPWAKAANHPVTTAEAVIAALDAMDRPATKAASADYVLPPRVETKGDPVPTLKASSWTKQASAPVAPPAPKPVDDRLRREAKAAAAFDRLRDALHPLTAAQYAGVKAAAEFACPGAGAEVMAFLEQRDVFLENKAAAAAAKAPDVTINTAHPAVQAVRDIVGVKAGYVVPPDPRPLGYRKMARDAGGTWFERRPAVPTVVIGGPVEPEPAALELTVPFGEKAAGLEESAPAGRGGFGQMMRRKVDSLNDFYTPEKNKDGTTTTPGTAAGRAFNYGTFGTLNLLANNPYTAPALDVRDPGADPELDKQVGKLNRNMDLLDHQTAVQEVMQDPRLMRSDPKTVIHTYQTLSDLAPNVMRNQSVAADLIHRRLQTGPLSAFDLKQLLDMEKAFVTSRRSATRPDEDDL